MGYAVNVLVDIVDGKTRCIVSDFGQSELKSEAYRLSGTPLPRASLALSLFFFHPRLISSFPTVDGGTLLASTGRDNRSTPAADGGDGYLRLRDLLCGDTHAGYPSMANDG